VGAGGGQVEVATLDPIGLRRALSSSIGGRGKVAVVHAGAQAFGGAEALDAVASDLALLRALGARLVVVCASGPGAFELVAALARHGEKGVVLPAAGLVRAASATSLTAVDSVLIIQLTSLAYIPIVSPPALDASGALVEVCPEALAAGIAMFTGAQRLVFAGASPSDETARRLAGFGGRWTSGEGRRLLECFLVDEAAA
jgi:acetylglutamate kinase